jgi:glutaminyl-peptide cyclotransferase
MKKMERPGLRLEFHLAALLLLFIGCSQDPNKGDVKAQPEVQVEVPVFSADSAFANVSRQVEFGPRVPGTAAHRSCGDWLESRLRTWADTVISQQFKTRTFDGKTIDGRNIIASFHPELGNRIMLCAHWDTRPFSDQDPENKNVPIDGANDGGSGVGVLLEVARHLSEKDPGIGIDIILFDVEDYGQPDDSPLPRVEDSYCLGSQYWSRNFHVRNYTARYGILLDMVGGKDLRFTQEGTSLQYAPYVVDRVWKIAAAAGFSSVFVPEQSKPIIDDHYYVNRLAGIRCIDLIHYDYSSESKFWKHWHTRKDSLNEIDPNSLRITGQVLLELLYREAVAS